jgi:DNA polymerase-3 subunit gamma/tau
VTAAPEPPAPVEPEPPAPVEPEPAQSKEQPASGGLSLVEVRRLWPDIVDATKLRRRVAWMHLTQNCQVVAVDGQTLTLGFTNAGARDSFVNGGCDEVLRQAAVDVVGADWKIETIVDPGATPEGQPRVTRPAVPPASEPAAQEPPPKAEPEPATPPQKPDWAAADAEAHPDDVDAEHQDLSSAELLRRELGAETIEEIPHQ